MHRRSVVCVVDGLESRRLFSLVTFTVDPALSKLTLSGDVANVFDLEQQHSGSLVETYEGSIRADVTDGAVSFPGGIDVVAQSKGNYDPGGAPANYAAKGETGGLFSTKLGEAAIRGLTFEIKSTDAIDLTGSGAFVASGLRFHTTGGTLAYDLRIGGDGEKDLSGKTVDNAAAGNATLRGEAGAQTLTIPVDVSYEEGDSDLRLRGTIVATVGGGAPLDNNAVRIGDGTANRSVQFTDADGTLTTISLKGGTADVAFENATGQAAGKKGTLVVQGTGVRLVSIDAAGTSAKTKLSISAKGGADGAVNVSSVITDGPVAALGGKGTIFTGTVSLGGAAGTVTAGGFDGATFTATSVGALAVGGNVTNSTITLSDPFVGGSFGVGKFAVGGTMSGSTLSAGGNIGNVKVTNLVGSSIEAGIAEGAGRFPQTGDLPAATGIGNVTTKTFSDSIIASHTLGKLKLGVIDTDNAGTPFGITGDFLASVQATNAARQKLKLGAFDDATALASALAAQPFDAGDFTIRLA